MAIVTNQDKINQIYAQHGGDADAAWAASGTELNSLVSNRSATYSGDTTGDTTVVNNNNSGNSGNSGSSVTSTTVYDSLAAANAAGMHGKAVQLKGKSGTFLVKFAEGDDDMKAISDAFNTSGGNTNESSTYTLSNLIGTLTDPTGIFRKGFNYIVGISKTDVATGDKLLNGKTVYKKQDGSHYALNFLGMPYDVEMATITRNNGESWTGFRDKLSLKVDADGKILTDQNQSGQTGYAFKHNLHSTDGDNESSTQLTMLEQAQAQENAEELTVAETVHNWALDAGIDKAGMEAILADPEKYLTERGLTLEDIATTKVDQLKEDSEAENLIIDGDADKFAMDPSGVDAQLTQIAESSMSTVDDVTTPTASTYTAVTNTDKMADGSYDMTAATGTITSDNLVDASTIETDINAVATGVNSDGTVNQIGVAINDYASQNFSTIIDTNTVSGKNLAKALGEGNYVDEKATITGQMKIISEQFVNDKGQSVIPRWAQSIARSVSQTIAFDGITGSAQTSAMATALMEATLGIAEKEATFFQTLTTKNLDNRQQAIINKANVLSNFEIANLGARQAAAVQNAKSFLEMDLTNLSNEQQAALINKQERTQALFEDSKILNAQRLFTAEQNNEFKKFYSELNVSIEKHNTTEMNALRRFNTGEANDMASANSELRNNREKWYQEMQYNIDTSNAKWRQDIITKGFETTWDAISTDVKSKLDITTETQNQIWDSTELLLDWIGKTTNGNRDAEVTLLSAQLNAQSKQSDGGGIFGALLSIGGTILGLPKAPFWWS